MIKRAILVTTASLALTSASPALADAHVEPDSEGISADAMDQAMSMIGDLFEAEELTDEQLARLPAATTVVSTMLPEGFYSELMADMMDSIMGPMMGMMSGELAATGVLASRLSADEAALQELSAEQKIELASILDPAFGDRGVVMETLMGDIMTQAAIQIEPVYREGMSRAYAVRFNEAQLADIAEFFETPTGAIYATENMKLMADPQVMSASMQALPAMMSQFGDMEARMEEAFADLPAEKTYAELTQAERERVSALTGIAVSELEAAVLPPRDDDMAGDSFIDEGPDYGGATAEEAVVEETM